MANGKTPALETHILNWLRGTSFPATANKYVALFTAGPCTAEDGTDDQTGDAGNTELTETNYQRVRVDTILTAPATDGGTGLQIDNTGTALDMLPLGDNTVQGGGFTVTGWAIVDGATKGGTGEDIYYYVNGLSVAVSTGDSLQFADGALVIGED